MLALIIWAVLLSDYDPWTKKAEDIDYVGF